MLRSISKLPKSASLNFLHSLLFSDTSQKPSALQILSTLDSKSKEKLLHIKIPRTQFNPRFHAKTSEVSYHPLISEGLYDWQLANKPESENFILHEGPMSLHEELHIGHFFNKTIKDIILRNLMMKGKKIDFRLGFNSHGQAIENAALRKYRESDPVKELNEEEIREICRNYVKERLDDYLKTLKRWGIMTDFKFYSTSDLDYETAVLDIFQRIYEKGSLIQQWRPLYWSVIHKKPVFEDEIKHEYAARKGYFIKYQVIDYGKDEFLQASCPKLFLVAFSPEPWTLTASQTLTLNPGFTYCIFEKSNEFLLMHEQTFHRNKSIFSQKNGYSFVMRTLGMNLKDLKVRDSLLDDKSFGVLLTKEIKGSIGSGINPLCPAHYSDDHKIGFEQKLSAQGFLDEAGNIAGYQLETLNGKNVILDDANTAILSILAEKGLLIEGVKETYNVQFHLHRETNEQIIIRSIPLWFCEVKKEEKEEFLSEVKKNIKIRDFSQENSFYPSFLQIVEEIGTQFPISHHGYCGIPLPLFYYKSSTRPFIKSDILSHTIRQMKTHGSDIWWKWPVESLLPKKYLSMAKKVEKSREVLDIWFELGCSQQAVIDKKKDVENSSNKDIDLIVEGKDQCECWLMGLAMVNMKTTTNSSIKEIKHHALIKDPETNYTNSIDKFGKYSGKKYNLEDIIDGAIKLNGERQYGMGVDVIRWFVASRDYLSKPEIFEIFPQDIDQANSEINLLRKCFREMLMHLNHEFPKQFYMDLNDLSFLHDFIYTNLIMFLYNVNKAYENYDISKVYSLIMDFVKVYVWDIYVQSTKGFLISNPLDHETYSIVYLYTRLCESLILVLAPLLPHNAQNIYEEMRRGKEKSVFHLKWPEVSQEQVQKIIARLPHYKSLLNLRSRIIKEMVKTVNRVEKDFHKIAEEFELVFINDPSSNEQKLLNMTKPHTKNFFGVSSVKFETQAENERREDRVLSSIHYVEKDGNASLEFKVKAYQAKLGKKCYRCLRKQSEREGELCLSCRDYLNKHMLRIENLTEI